MHACGNVRNRYWFGILTRTSIREASRTTSVNMWDARVVRCPGRREALRGRRVPTHRLSASGRTHPLTGRKTQDETRLCSKIRETRQARTRNSQRRSSRPRAASLPRHRRNTGIATCRFQLCSCERSVLGRHQSMMPMSPLGLCPEPTRSDTTTQPCPLTLMGSTSVNFERSTGACCRTRAGTITVYQPDAHLLALY